MIAIIDYGVGNLFSLKSSLGFIGAETVVTGEEELIRKADKLILPGVGAFEDAIAKLKEKGLDEVVIDEAKKGKPLLGICLGMQMLFDESHEYGCHKGLGLIPGKVMALEDMIPSDLKIPHIGWNSLEIKKGKLYKYIENGDFVYFVHSFAAVVEAEYLSAVTDYGATITASVENENVFGMQFHPEKSGTTGLKILKAFCEL